MLMLAGENDPLVPKGRLEELQAVAFISPRVDIKSYPGVGRLLEGARDQVAADTVAWLTDIGLPPAPTIETEVLDVTSADGQLLSGILYAPSMAPPSDLPIFVILHGWTSDIMRSVPHWLGVRLAQAGYPAIAIQHRASGFRGIVRHSLESIEPDMRVWMDELERRGFESVVAVGHGAAWVVGAGSLARVEPGTGERLGIEGVVDPVDVTTDSDWVWVTDAGVPGQRAPGR